MGQEEGGELSGDQIPQGFIILVRRAGCSPEGKKEQMQGEESGQLQILERSLPG